jgi:hypothetical protein
MSLPIQDDNKKEAHDFYHEALQLLNEKKYPFLMGGAFALRLYSDIYRDTKDLDIFCRATDYQKILKLFSDKGYEVEITDPRWLAKVFHKGHFIDIIFNTTNNICVVDDSWFDNAIKGELFDVPVLYVAPEELFWSKSYVQNRERYDGADLNHLILKYGTKMDWKRVLMRMDQHWHLLLAQFLNFQFVYPSERNIIPRWIFDELVERAKIQFDLPSPIAKVCLGPLVDHTQYKTDIFDWGYKIITTRSV